MSSTISKAPYSLVVHGLRTISNSVISDPTVAEVFTRDPASVLLRYPIEDPAKGAWSETVNNISNHLRTITEVARIPVFHSLVDLATASETNTKDCPKGSGPDPQVLLPIALANVLVVANITALANGAISVNVNVNGSGAYPQNVKSSLNSLEIRQAPGDEIDAFAACLNRKGLSYARQVALIRRVVKDGNTVQRDPTRFSSTLTHTLGTIRIGYVKDGENRVLVYSASIDQSRS